MLEFLELQSVVTKKKKSLKEVEIVSFIINNLLFKFLSNPDEQSVCLGTSQHTFTSKQIIYNFEMSQKAIIIIQDSFNSFWILIKKNFHEIKKWSLAINVYFFHESYTNFRGIALFQSITHLLN